MKKIIFVLLISLTISCNENSSNKMDKNSDNVIPEENVPSEKIAKDVYLKRIEEEAPTNCKLNYFKKTNGMESTGLYGEKIYKVEFEGEIEILKDSWFVSSFGKPKFATSFPFIDITPTKYLSKFTLSGYGESDFGKVKKGEKYSFNGDMYFKNSEKGWVKY